MKQTVFMWLDFLTFGMFAIIPIIATVATIASGAPLQFNALMSVVSLTFAAIYVYILYMRCKNINSVQFFTDKGWGVRNISSVTVTKEAVDSDIAKAIENWKEKIVWDSEIDKALEQAYLLIFQDGIIADQDFVGKKITGELISARTTVFVGTIKVGLVDSRPIEKTALKHEVGHIIYEASGLNGDCHAFMAEKGLS